MTVRNLLFMFLLGSALAKTPQTPEYTNPIVTPVAADPDVIRTEDGFYLYATQDDWGDGHGDRYMPIFKSPDLVNWDYVGTVFASPPGWKPEGGFLWAPDISHHDGSYYLYYAYSLWGDPNPCIGLATAEHPEGPWYDLGRAVFCSQDIGVRNSIDPFVWYEDGVLTMIWGSFHGIYAVQLDESGTEAVGEKVQLADHRFEGAYVHAREGFYYLFVSAGSCCEGAQSTYHTYVGRSESLTGPYLDMRGWDLRYGGGAFVLLRNDDWIGPGHVTMATDDAGVDWLIYHAIPPDNPRIPSGATRRPALLDRIDWTGGWPVVNNGEGPSTEPQPAPVIE